MNRRIVRTYHFTNREVNEALLFWMKSQDLQQPKYVGDTDCTKWVRDPEGGIRLEWTDDDEIEVST